MNDRRAFRENLKALLKERGLTQKEFARLSGLTECQVSHYLSGYRLPETAVLMRIADALSVSVSYLLGLDESETPYERISAAIEADGRKLTPEEKIRLIMQLSK